MCQVNRERPRCNNNGQSKRLKWCTHSGVSGFAGETGGVLEGGRAGCFSGASRAAMIASTSCFGTLGTRVCTCKPHKTKQSHAGKHQQKSLHTFCQESSTCLQPVALASKQSPQTVLREDCCASVQQRFPGALVGTSSAKVGFLSFPSSMDCRK